MSTDPTQVCLASIGDFSDLPFRLFACIADRDPGVNVREAQSFMQLIQSPGWTRSPVLGAVLAATDGRYSALWKEYVAGRLPADATTVRRRTVEWLQSMAETERPQAQADFNVLARNLFNARAPWWRRRFTARSRGITLENLLSRLGPATNAPGGTNIVAEARDVVATKPLLDVVLDPPGFWRRGGVKLRCIAVIDETPDVKTFRFAPIDPVLFCYKAGQAATLEVPIDGKVVRRTYTISSSPSRPLVIEFTVKRIPGGQVSNWLHTRLHAGTALTIHGPHGRFTYYDHPSLEPLLLCAGSGITPMLAITRWLTDTSTPARIDLLHYATKPTDLIARVELEQLQKRFSNLRVTWVCTRPDDGWSGERGRLSQQSLQQLLPDFRERDIFLCGPAPFMETARHMLLAAGCDESRIHQESFGVRSHQAESGSARVQAAATVGELSTAGHTLRLCSSAKAIPCGAGLSVLEALEAAGITVPFSCRAGACGTCKLLKRKGAVAAPECEGLSAIEQEQGYFLSCCARPTTDLELEL